MLSRKISIAISSLLCCNATFTISPLTSCSKVDTIQLANYESYMAPELMENLQSQYKIQFPYYTVAEMIPAKFEKYYDIAIPCGYELLSLLSKDWLEEIDWAKFNIQWRDEYDDLHDVKNATDAKHLFVMDGIDQMNEQFTQYIKDQGKSSPLYKYLIDGKFNILRFGVPYFGQSFMFAYTGTEITFYKSGTNIATSAPTWADIFYTISPNNPKQEQRFKDKKIALVDDARSFYDVSRIVESTENQETEITNDVTKDDSRDRMFKTMNHITNKFDTGKSSFILNSDSQIVSKSLADRKGDATAIMSWSGDTIYAAQGAEEYEPFTSENLHIQKPFGASLDEIEFMVMNKKNQNNTTKRNNIYNVVKQCCLDGCSATEDEIVEYVDKDERFKYWTMTNWDNILYVPLLKNIHAAVCNKEEFSSYWTDQQEEKHYSDDTIKMFIDIINGEVQEGCKHLYGKTLTNLQNSNNHWAWLESRGKL